MNKINHKLTETIIQPVNMPGTVTHCFVDGSVSVESEARGWHCNRAVSCLITPQVGDKVLITSVAGRIWLLAVLERDESRVTELSIPGDLHILSAGELSFCSQKIRIMAEQGDCHIDDMKYSGDKVSAWVSLSRIVGKRAESVWQTITQISHNLLRTTYQTEQIRAGQLDIKATDYARIHANNTIITSKAITKIDSEQIHMG